MSDHFKTTGHYGIGAVKVVYDRLPWIFRVSLGSSFYDLLLLIRTESELHH